MGTPLLIASKSELFCAGIQRLLANDPEIELLAATGDYARAAALATQRGPLTVAVDLGIDVADAIDLLGRLATISGTRLVAMVSEFHYPTAERARRAGASSIVHRGSSLAEFKAALLNGRGNGSDTGAGLCATYAGKPAALALAQRLTRLECRVLRLMANGCDEPTIQAKLHISRGERERMQTRVADAAGTANLAHLTKIALREGLTRLNGVSKH